MAIRAEPQLSTTDALAQLAFLVHGALERRAGERELSIVQIRLLGILRDRTPTMNELAALLGLDKSSVTGLVSRAERRGLVARVPSPHDGRVVLVQLSGTGRRAGSRVAAAFDADVAALLAPLPAAERRALTATATRVLVGQAAERGVELFPR